MTWWTRGPLRRGTAEGRGRCCCNRAPSRPPDSQFSQMCRKRERSAGTTGCCLSALKPLFTLQLKPAQQFRGLVIATRFNPPPRPHPPYPCNTTQGSDERGGQLEGGLCKIWVVPRWRPLAHSQECLLMLPVPAVVPGATRDDLASLVLRGVDDRGKGGHGPHVGQKHADRE